MSEVSFQDLLLYLIVGENCLSILAPCRHGQWTLFKMADVSSLVLEKQFTEVADIRSKANCALEPRRVCLK